MPVALYRKLEALSGLLNPTDHPRLLLVADAMACEASGADERLAKILNGFSVLRFDRFTPYPTMDELLEGIRFAREVAPQAVIGVGGGTALDLAKMISIAWREPELSTDLIRENRFSGEDLVPLIAIPTTAGTGSEATPFAALYIDGVKASIRHPAMIPSAAVVDAGLTESMPASLTMATGLDALCQGLESLWSNRATPESMRYGWRALRLAYTHLEKAVTNPDLRARRAMALASWFSGRAIHISRTTACHAMSYELTQTFGIPHGQAVAVTAPALLRFNAGASEAGFAMKVICRMFDAEDPEEAATRLEALLDRMGCPRTLSAYGVQPADHPALAAAVNAERAANNPRAISREQWLELLARC